MSYLVEKCESLYKAAQILSSANGNEKNEALEKVAISIEKNKFNILQSNKVDIENARKKNMKESLIDRLSLDEKRLDSIIESIYTVIKLDDPVWKSNKAWTLENGLTITSITVPMGIIGIIYESRPNVTVDAFSLALKSGNCVLLRGSSSSINSNKALVSAIKEGLRNSNIGENVVEYLESNDRKLVLEMLKMNKYLDLIIPRGGKELIDFVVNNSTVPTIQTGTGNCHIFIDESANIDNAIQIVKNAKIQRPGVCNACETILVHSKVANLFLKKLFDEIHNQVELRGCNKTIEIIPAKKASEEDWDEEYLDYILAVKVVSDIHEAIEHIALHGTKHSEAIITESLTNANLFQKKVDAAAVYVNASTRFTDGGQFGFGAEMGISTQKIHARGPVGLEQLVTTKYLIMGNGQIRE